MVDMSRNFWVWVGVTGFFVLLILDKFELLPSFMAMAQGFLNHAFAPPQ